MHPCLKRSKGILLTECAHGLSVFCHEYIEMVGNYNIYFRATVSASYFSRSWRWYRKYSLYTSYSVQYVCIWASVRERRLDRSSSVNVLNICAILWRADWILGIIILQCSIELRAITRSECFIARFFLQFSIETLKRSWRGYLEHAISEMF